MRESRKIVRYVLIIPRWASLMVLVILICALDAPFGPMASNQV